MTNFIHRASCRSDFFKEKSGHEDFSTNVMKDWAKFQAQSRHNQRKLNEKEL